jgi:glycosyltransferase involved in cell wall biosynthesis
METELVSVIMPVHNAGPYLAESLRSVKEQTYRPLEIVAFDDHSTDNSWEILESWREIFLGVDIRPVFIQSTEAGAKGPGFGRNNCILSSTGTFLCHLDADVSVFVVLDYDMECVDCIFRIQCCHIE